MASHANLKAEVHAFLDKWHRAAAEGDFDFYTSSMAEDAHWFGTDATEDWDKEAFMAFAKPRFEAKQAWSFTAVERNVYVNSTGTIAWFDEVLDTWMKACRGSGVVEKVDGQWKVHQFVLSMAIPNGEGKDELQKEVLPRKGKYEDAMLAEMHKNPKRN